MVKKQKKITAAGEWVEYRLRQLCGEITPDKRLVVTLTLFFLFAGLSLYITVSSIYRFGKDEGERLNIRHIEQLQLQLDLKERQHETDSLKQSKKFPYEYERK
jgi:hypothetical protein